MAVCEFVNWISSGDAAALGYMMLLWVAFLLAWGLVRLAVKGWRWLWGLPSHSDAGASANGEAENE